VRRWIADLVDHYQPTTIQKAYQLFAACMEQAVDDNLIPKTPCRGIQLPKREPSEQRVLMPDEVARLAEAIDPRFHALILAAAYTGLRAGELAGLRLHDLDLLRRRLTVRQTMTNVRGHIEFGPPKTPASRRSITLPRLLCHVLAQYLAAYPTSSQVFKSADGRPIRWNNFRRRFWKAALWKAGLDPAVRFHDLRHSHASMLINAGEPVTVVQHRLGHASPAVTLNVYAHLFDGLDERAADRLDDVFSEGRASETRQIDTPTHPASVEGSQIALAR
jgi:integrase